MELMRRRRGIMGLNGGAGIPVITATATGNLLTFETDLARPLKSLVIPFTPIQAAGTPSPDNPLPISGWTGCEITHTGKNLVGANTLELGLFNPTTGEAEDSTTVFRSKHKIPVAPGETFTMSISGTRARIWPAIYWWDANGNYINRSLPTANVTTFTATAPANARWMGFHQSIGSLMPSIDAFVNTYEAQWEKGASRTVYELHQDETIPINWQSEAGTIYGGTLTLNEDGSADLVSNWQYGIVSELWPSGWTYISNVTTPYFEHNTNVNVGLRESSLCSMYKYALPSGANMPDLSFGVISNGTRIRIRNSNYTTVKAFMAAMADVYIAFPLWDSSISIKTYHFNDIGQLTTFLGTNNIWTDTNGTNTATYLKHQS